MPGRCFATAKTDGRRNLRMVPSVQTPNRHCIARTCMRVRTRDGPFGLRFDTAEPPVSVPQRGSENKKLKDRSAACPAPFIFALVLKSEKPQPRTNAAHRGST